jgi:predicted helicase
MSKTKDKTQVFHFDLYGKREAKYDFLNENSLSSIAWNELEPNEPNFFFVKKDDTGVEEYEKGFKLDELFLKNISGIQTGRDSLFIDSNKEDLIKRIKKLLEEELSIDFKEEFNIKDSSSYNLLDRITRCNFDYSKINETLYKPFQKYYIYYDEILLKRAFYSVFKNVINRDNVGFNLMRSQVNTTDFKAVFLSKTIIDLNFYGFQSYHFPLYLYPDQKSQLNFEQQTERVPNLNLEIVQKIAEGLGLKFEAESISPFEGGQRGMTQNLKQEKSSNSPLSVSPQGEKASDPVSIERGSQFFCPIDILDYIYAVLHSPSYREQYKEFLKIDFPRVPYPTDADKFWNLVELGGKLRELHLLESPTVNEFITEYQGDGDNVVGKPRFEVSLLEEGLREVTQIGRVHINENQYFDNVPETAWNFYIGGYQPAQKWLKDRKERELNFEDILHYQKIIVALTETSRLMGEIDEVGV